MARSALSSNRTALTRSRNELHPQSYNTYNYGDSFMSSGSVSIGESLRLFTSELHSYNAGGATGGWTTAQIKTEFDATYPIDNINLYLYGTGINSILGVVATATIKSEIASVIDTILAAGDDVLIIGPNPWYGHASWTAGKQAATDEIIDWLATTYPNNFVPTYDALESSTVPNQLAAQFLTNNQDTTNLHINDNGRRKVEELISGFLFYRDSPQTITSPQVGDYVVGGRDSSTWETDDAVISTDCSVLMQDGTYASDRGIIPPYTAGITSGVKVANFTGAADGTAVIASFDIRPGVYDWFRADIQTNAGLHTLIINAVTQEKGTAGNLGASLISIEKLDRGWSRVTFNIPGGNNTGSTANYLKCFACQNSTTVGLSLGGGADGFTPAFYIDNFTMVDA